MNNYKLILTKEFLIAEYIINKKSTTEIAKPIGCGGGTICRYLKKYNIRIRTSGELLIQRLDKILNRKSLYEEYITNKKSIKQISKLTNCDTNAVGRYLKKYDIKIRNSTEAALCRKNTTIKKYKTKYYCKDCKKEIHYNTAKYGSAMCKSCSTIEKYKNPKNNPNYRHGKCVDPKCIDCDKKIHPQAKRCKKCEFKNHSRLLSGKNNFMFGKSHTNESIDKMLKTRKRNGVSFRGKNNPMYGKVVHGKGSYYKNHYMRSSWEIAYAKYLDNNNIKWLYEPKPFEITYNYKGIEKEGTYTPDFYLPETDEYIEIKGWWRDDAKAKYDAFKSQYLTTKLILLMKKELKLLKVLT